MNENIDLIKILDGCPEGTEFYSDTFGKLFFYCIEPPTYNPFKVAFKDCNDRYCAFNKDGRYYMNEHSDCSVSVFPSKEQRDWSKFVRFWDKPKIERFDPKTLKPFQRVLVRDTNIDVWQCEMFSHSRSCDADYPFFCCGNPYHYCIPYNSETEHLLGTTEEAPGYYRYWEDE